MQIHHLVVVDNAPQPPISTIPADEIAMDAVAKLAEWAAKNRLGGIQFAIGTWWGENPNLCLKVRSTTLRNAVLCVGATPELEVALRTRALAQGWTEVDG